MKDRLVIKGARRHNPRDISVELPRNALTVFTGVSGSGKSSLAFDTIFAEGLRRYVESLSVYARQFLGQLDKPDVDVIYDHLRPLYAGVGRPHCPECGEPVERRTPQRIVDRLLAQGDGVRVQVPAPVVRDRTGEHADVFKQLRADGFSRARVDGEVHPPAGPPQLDRRRKHSIDVVVDRLAVKASARQRLTESVETALGLAGGVVCVDLVDLDACDPEREVRFSERMACPRAHGIGLDALEPRLFSFDAPWGACPECTGPGTAAPWRQLPAAAKKVVLHGFREQVHITYRNRFGRERSHLTRFEGVLPHVTRRYAQTPAALAVTVAGRAIAELTALPIDQLARFVPHLEPAGGERRGAADPSGHPDRRRSGRRAVRAGRTEHRAAPARPSTAHRDSAAAAGPWQHHDRRRARRGDREGRRPGGGHLAGAGAHGGHVVHSGTARELLDHPTSLTGACPSGRRRIPLAAARRARTERPAITAHDAGEHNLREVSVPFPLGQFVAVTGVSDSGKSTLVDDILCTALAERLHRHKVPGRHRAITGVEQIDKVVQVDQSDSPSASRAAAASAATATAPSRSR